MSESNQFKNTKNPKSPFNWRKILVFFVLLFLLAYLISLIIINTSWFKNKITSQLQSRFPIQNEWEIGNISWIPFGKVNAYDLKTKLGEGGLSLVSIKTDPSWTTLFKGDVELEEITIQGVHLDLDLKWLIEQQSKLSTPVNKPPATLNNKQVELGKKSTEPLKNPVSETNKKQKAETKNQTKDNSAPKDAEPKVVVEIPNKWILVDDLKFTLRDGKTIIDQVDGIKLRLPISGKPTDGEVSYQFHENKYSQRIHWDGKQLSAENLSGKQFGVSYQWNVRCSISNPGTPFSFNLTAPKQAINTKINQPNYHWSLKALSAQANISLSGSLKAPYSWRGIIQASADGVTISEDQKTHKRAEFDTVRFTGDLNRGLLHVPLVEALGYDVSIIGNGAIQKNLYSYGVIRIITHERSSRFFNRVYRGTKAIKIEKKEYQFFESLDTADRGYCDLYFDGQLSNLMMRHNRSDHWQKVKPIIKKLISFKDEELKEDGILELSEEGE